MSDKDNYAPGTYNHPDAPWNQPDPIEDTDEFQAEQLRQWNERIEDIQGYFLESLSEADIGELKRLALLVRDNQNGTFTEAIGHLVTKLVLEYTKPSDDDVLDVLNEPPYYPQA